MVLSKTKPNKASHMRLEDRRTSHRLHMLGQAFCPCSSMGQGSSTWCSGRPCPTAPLGIRGLCSDPVPAGVLCLDSSR